LLQKIGSNQIFKSTSLSSAERLESVLDTAIRFAKENKYEKALFAWDSNVHPVASLLTKRSESILGTGLFSTGVLEKPLNLIEIGF
jgi:hypothetical protein